MIRSKLLYRATTTTTVNLHLPLQVTAALREMPDFDERETENLTREFSDFVYGPSDGNRVGAKVTDKQLWKWLNARAGFDKMTSVVKALRGRSGKDGSEKGGNDSAEVGSSSSSSGEGSFLSMDAPLVAAGDPNCATNGDDSARREAMTPTDVIDAVRHMLALPYTPLMFYTPKPTHHPSYQVPRTNP